MNEQPILQYAEDKPDTIYLQHFTVEFLDRYFQLNPDYFAGNSFMDELKNLLLSVLPDFYEYTHSIIIELFKLYPKEFGKYVNKEAELYSIDHVIDEDIPYLKRKNCWKIISDITREYLSRIKLPKIPENNTFSEAENKLKEYLGITQNQVKLLTFFYIIYAKRNYQTLMTELELFDGNNIDELSFCLGMSKTEFMSEKKLLDEADFLEYRRSNLPTPNDSICDVYDPYIKKDPSSWYDSLDVEHIPLDYFLIEKNQLNLLKQMLTNSRNRSANILLYGETGTGKTTLVSSLSYELGLKIFNVKSGLREDDGGRRCSLFTCVNLASRFNGKAVVLVDEAERMLDTSFGTNTNSKDKAWLNSFLENKKVSIIWVTNQIYHIDQAVRRRFDFSLYFPVLTKIQRMKLWDKVLGKYNVSDLISRTVLSRLNRKYEVPVSVMDRAVDFAKDLSSDSKGFVLTLRTQLESFIALRQGGINIKELNKKIQKDTDGEVMPQNSYTPEGVNFECDINEFITGIKKLDEYVKNTKKPKSGCGTILFYGPSGTGKSELARYIAKLTRRKAVVKKASDILNCYVGESEKNVAKAFRDLNLKKEILVIDEVDSFLYNRSTANESWENTLVNEFLTQLQEFKGILICTTNLKTGLDPAVMRRFSFKLEFKYSEGKQVEALFNSILKPISGKDLSKEELTELLSMKNLTPGDFHVVEDKFCSFFTVSEKTGNKDLLNALKEEQKKKNEQSESHRRIGFI